MLSRASLFCRRGGPAAATTARPGPLSLAASDPVRCRWRTTTVTARSLLLRDAAPAAATTTIGLSPYSPHYHSPGHHSSSSPRNNHRKTQYRSFAGRKDRASASLEARPPTRKQRKAYHRRRRKNEHEKNKHSAPGSKAVHRRLEDQENTESLIEIAREEESLKTRLMAHFDKVNELQAKIEDSPKFRVLLAKDSKHTPEEVHAAARDAAKRAAEKSDAPHPPLPSWWQERLTYDWGDALVDDLMGNSADLTSSPGPSPTFMGGEYGRLRRRVERIVRGREEAERLRLEDKKVATSSSNGSSADHLAPDATTGALSVDGRNRSPSNGVVDRGPAGGVGALSDRLISDLIRAHRDAHGRRTTPVGLAASLEMLHELRVPHRDLGTWSVTSLLTCCTSPWEGRKVDELRREHGVRSNGYFWSAMVDVYSRSGDYRGAGRALDEMIEETRREATRAISEDDAVGGTRKEKVEPIPIPPLPAYTSFLSACHKLISRPDVHPSVKTDAADMAWERWKEMRVHSVPPDVMAYGALMRVFAAQGRAERALDLLQEVMAQMMNPVNADSVIGDGKGGEGLKKDTMNDFGEDGWYDDADGNTVRVKPTTLLFTSALKAVAKSHEVATKFTGGKSRKNRRREMIASYHGRLARKIVVLAEQAEVKQDDGFVAALMLCAAAAGDSSTARAIYLASKVRRLDHLRTCGGKEHLMRLQGLIPENEKRMLEGGMDDDDNGLPMPSENGLVGGGASGSVPGMLQRGLGTSSSSAPAIRTMEDEFEEEHAVYEHREYGTDTRIFSALLLAHSKAMEAKGLGNMWAGRYNRGYLCENSVRYMEAYNRPQMENMAIPGLDSVQAGLTPEGSQPEEFDEGKAGSSKQLRKKHKFNIKQIMDDGEGNRRDTLDSFFDGFDKDPDELRRRELEQLDAQWLDKRYMFGPGKQQEENEEDVGRDWLDETLYGNDKGPTLDLPSGGDEDGVLRAAYRPGEDAINATVLDNKSPSQANNYDNDFDSDSDDDDYEIDSNANVEEEDDGVRFDAPPRNDREALVQALAEATNDRKLADSIIPQDLDLSPNGQNKLSSDGEEDFDPDDYFDEDAWEKLMAETQEGIDESKGGDAEELFDIPGVATNDFAAFRAHLEKELVEEGRPSSDVDEKEARQLFDMMLTYNDQGSSEQIADAEIVNGNAILNEDAIESGKTFTDKAAESDLNGTSQVERSFAMNAEVDTLQQRQLDGPALERQRITPSADTAMHTIYADDYMEWANSQQQQAELSAVGSKHLVSSVNNVIGEAGSNSEQPTLGIDHVPLPRHHKSPLDLEEVEPHIAELQEILPGLPMNRIKKVSDEFEKTLGYPSILKLTLAVRENMPEAFSPQCLARKNLANAMHLMSEAEKEGLVDAHLLNGMLRVYTNSGRIEPALRFYDKEFRKHGMTPTKHSDRLLLEMLVKKKRIERAFKLKQDIEKEGRSIDLLCYGTLVEHFGNRNQLGSALLLIKECIDVHGSPPGEKCLKNIRLLCRQNGYTDQVDLERMVGKDPLEWFRRGEELKRVQNKKGNSSAVMYGLNSMLNI